MVEVDDILSRLIPQDIRRFIDELVRRKEREQFDRTPEDLKLVIMVLKGGETKPTGPIMDRIPRPVLPRNPFQI